MHCSGRLLLDWAHDAAPDAYFASADSMQRTYSPYVACDYSFQLIRFLDTCCVGVH